MPHPATGPRILGMGFQLCKLKIEAAGNFLIRKFIKVCTVRECTRMNLATTNLLTQRGLLGNLWAVAYTVLFYLQT